IIGMVTTPLSPCEKPLLGKELPEPPPPPPPSSPDGQLKPMQSAPASLSPSAPVRPPPLLPSALPQLADQTTTDERATMRPALADVCLCLPWKNRILKYLGGGTKSPGSCPVGAVTADHVPHPVGPAPRYPETLSRAFRENSDRPRCIALYSSRAFECPTWATSPPHEGWFAHVARGARTCDR